MRGSWHWLIIAFLAVTDAQQLNGPIIMSPKEILLQKGENYTIHCKGNRPLQFKQQELPEEVVGNFTKTQRNVAPSDDQFEYEVELGLYNVDQFAVGYYACHDDSVAEDDVLGDLMTEPRDTDHVAYTYVFVNDSELIVPMREIVFVKPGSKVVIECKPTFPDIQVNLTMDLTDIEYERYSPKIGFVLETDDFMDVPIIVCSCDFMRMGGTPVTRSIFLHNYPTASVESPTIIAKEKYFLENDTIVLNCTVPYKSNTAKSLKWSIPRGNMEKVEVLSNEKESLDSLLYQAIRVPNAKEYDAGNYTCTVISKGEDEPLQDFVTLSYLNAPFIDLTSANKPVIETKLKKFKYVFNIKSYPRATYEIYKDGHLIKNSAKYEINETRVGSPYLTINYLEVEDTGNYTFVAKTANISKSLTRTLYKLSDPKVEFNMSGERRLVGSKATLECTATGYPLPSIKWTFIDDETNKETHFTGNNEVLSIYKVVSKITIPVTRPGSILCSASNHKRNFAPLRRLLVDEILGGFGIQNGGEIIKWIPENQPLRLRCLASKNDNFTSIVWLGPDDVELPPSMVEESNNSLSNIAKLKIDRILLSQAGNYTCVGIDADGFEKRDTITIIVAATRPPYIKIPEEDIETRVVHFKEKVNLVCVAEGVPPPTIEWYKNNEAVETKYVFTFPMNHTTVNSTYNFTKERDLADDIECIASNGDARLVKNYKINLQTIEAKSPFNTAYLGLIGVVILALIIIVVYLVWKIRKEKQFRKELAAAGLLYFKEGATKSLNPDRGIDEQADLLPYDDKFEFPFDKLKLGKQLGCGAFGVVYKAEARGINNAEVVTTVAVKMVRKTEDNMYIKALASELKIMVHLGKHVNIVNLLGACTKNIGKRELVVIVEYCEFGNIHNYLQRHREVFYDDLTDNKDKSHGNVNRGFSYSTASSGVNSDCLGSNQTQQTDHTFLNTAPSVRSGRLDKPKPQSESEKVSETGYVQPNWRPNYEGDYVYDKCQPRPLYSRDLLAWSFQIARGMEYLASRKVLHGDLAARNILLAKDNVVKICDFGLARSIYKNNEYLKKENSPLPVKWLALECLTDGIFSTQSDVWSFGIVLWEIFSLAKTPYHDISPHGLAAKLKEGHRMSKPPYANEKLYQIMRDCWETVPNKRPSFTELQQTLGNFLEDHIRNHYVELNESCEIKNAERTGEDYLEQVCAPDYNNQTTPSAHHYANNANGIFFGVNLAPTAIQLQHDDEGYLAMTPASKQDPLSPRIGPAFNFEARHLNTGSAASHGSELTPMLNLNHLSTRSGSESDQETASPYLNMCQRIDEETDEVFEPKENLKNSHNNAVTNLTYISFPSLDKKSPIIDNNYVNAIVNSNGLVK